MKQKKRVEERSGIRNKSIETKQNSKVQKIGRNMRARKGYLEKMLLLCSILTLSSLYDRTIKWVDGFRPVHRTRDMTRIHPSYYFFSGIKKSQSTARNARKVGSKKGHFDTCDPIDESQYSEWVEEEKQVHT